MSKHIVKTPVSHDNKDYAPGESIELDGKAAKALLSVGAIEAATKGKSTQEGKSSQGESTGAGE